MNVHGLPFRDDFEARLRFFTKEEGGRRSPIFNGIRWDLTYADEPGGLYMIPPDIVDENGDSFARETQLSVDTPLAARMFIVVDEMREQVHRSRLRVGVKFFLREGARLVAEGEVTRITGLHIER